MKFSVKSSFKPSFSKHTILFILLFSLSFSLFSDTLLLFVFFNLSSNKEKPFCRTVFNTDIGRKQSSSIFTSKFSNSNGTVPVLCICLKISSFVTGLFLDNSTTGPSTNAYSSRQNSWSISGSPTFKVISPLTGYFITLFKIFFPI